MRIFDGQKEVKSIRELEKKAASALTELRRLDGEFPSGPPIVWVPERIKQHFRRFGFAELTTRVETAVEEPELPGYQRIYWCVGLPIQNVKRHIGGLLLAVADLEQAEQIVRVADVEIPKEADEPGQNPVTVTFSTLVRK